VRGEAEAELLRIEDRRVAKDHAGFFEAAQAAQAGGGGERDLGGQVGVLDAALLLKDREDAAVGAVEVGGGVFMGRSCASGFGRATIVRQSAIWSNEEAPKGGGGAAGARDEAVRATTGSDPDEAGVRPQSRTPSSGSGSTPEATTGSDPDEAGVRPQSRTPSSGSGSTPEATTGSDPDEAGVRPQSRTTSSEPGSTPEATTVSDPDETGVRPQSRHPDEAGVRPLGIPVSRRSSDR
jgi:hypothetical protein